MNDDVGYWRKELNETEANHIAASIVPQFDPVDTKCVGELIDGAQSKRTKAKRVVTVVSINVIHLLCGVSGTSVEKQRE